MGAVWRGKSIDGFTGIDDGHSLVDVRGKEGFLDILSHDLHVCYNNCCPRLYLLWVA